MKVRYCHAIRSLTYTYKGARYHPEGDDIFAKEWDNLIILDACRFDEFRDACDWEGRLDRHTSRGCHSEEFVRGNFTGRTLHDVVYVSSNAWFEKLKGMIDSEVHRFILANRDAFDGVTTHPRTMTDLAKAVNRDYPDKRLIVHYLQPHSPYFTMDGEERFRLPAVERLHQIEERDFGRREIIQAYRENLQLVLSEVDRLLPELSGKTVITADHGELLGERVWPLPFRKYDHPKGLHVDQLLEVPWFELEPDGRKETTSEAPDSVPEPDQDDLDDRLKALGYRI